MSKGLEKIHSKMDLHPAMMLNNSKPPVKQEMVFEHTQQKPPVKPRRTKKTTVAMTGETNIKLQKLILKRLEDGSQIDQSGLFEEAISMLYNHEIG